MMEKKLITPVISCYTLERFRITKKLILQLLNIKEYIDKILIIVDKKDELYQKFKHNFGSNNIVEIKLNLFGFGLSNARNTGINYCKSDLIAFLDDDALIKKNWAKNAIKNFNNKDIVAVGGDVIPLWIVDRPKWASDEIDWIYSGLSYMKPKKSEIQSVRGANMIFRTSIFKRIGGGFNSNLGRKEGVLLSGDENEICYRIRKKLKNKKIIFDPSTVVYHIILPERVNIQYLLERGFYAGISISRLMKITGKENSMNLSNELSYSKYLLSNIIKKLFSIFSNFSRKINEILAILTLLLLISLGFVVESKKLIKPQKNIDVHNE